MIGGIEQSDSDEDAPFVGWAPLPAADAHVGPAEYTRDRPTGSIFNAVAYANFRMNSMSGRVSPPGGRSGRASGKPVAIRHRAFR